MASLFRLPPAGSAEYKSPLVLLFGFLFLTASCAMLLRIPYLFYQKSRLDDGLKVPAKILRLESVSSGGGRHGGRSSVSVGYEFKIRDSVIVGDRASIFSESNGLYFRLREAFESGREVTCFVDPADPAFSALGGHAPPWGRYWRIRPLVFSLVPRSHEWWGVAKWNFTGLRSSTCL